MDPTLKGPAFSGTMEVSLELGYSTSEYFFDELIDHEFASVATAMSTR
jgi:hypothetical protein